METFVQDARYAIRLLATKPGFSLIAIVTLALGIGASTSIFSIVNAVLFRPLPYKDADRLVMVWDHHRDRNYVTMPGRFIDWRDRNEVFESMAAYKDFATNKAAQFDLTGGDEPERIGGSLVSVNLFSMLGVEPTMGRVFLPEEGEKGRDRVALLSDGLWRRRFGADAGIIGKDIKLNGESYTVVGIMPPNFKLSYPKSDDLWIPMPIGAAERSNRKEIAYKVIARLKPGVTIEKAQERMSVLANALAEEYPDTDSQNDIRVVPMHEEVVGSTRAAFLILAGAVGFLLLIACVNVANLLLARATDRSREIAVRAALGASHLRLVRQLLTESIMLSVIGGAMGLLLAMWGTDILAVIIPSTVPRADEITTDGRVLGFSIILSALTGLIFGLIPALQASKPDLNASLREGAQKATGGRRTRRLRDMIVVSQIALALVLLAGAGLMIRSFWLLRQTGIGFDPDNVLTMQITLLMSKYRESHQRLAFCEQLRDRIRTLPGVEQASITTTVPFRGVDYINTFEIEGQPPLPSGENRAARYRGVDADYFWLMGIALLKGRLFSEQDRAGAPRVVVISEALARQYFPGQDPIGQRLNIDSGEEVIGIVSDVRHANPGELPEPAMYVPLHQRPINRISLLVRTASDPMTLAGAVQNEVWAIDRDQPIEGISTLEQIVAASVSDTRFQAIVLGAFAAAALMLAAVGIYGVIAYSVAQRTREIGIRMALGAQAGDMFRLVIRRGMTLALIGVAIGLGAAYSLTRLMESLLYEVSATDPVTFAGVALLLTMIALAACYIPARRAARVDPMVALRYE